MMEGIWGWDATPASPQWRKLIVDATGHLQVDVLTSGLPAGGSTAANQVLIIADTGTLVTEQGRCYGWDTANWQRLTLEGVGLHNLRVRLYDGANGIDSSVAEAALVNKRGLVVAAALFGRYGAGEFRSIGTLQVGADALTNSIRSLNTVASLTGYNGATWDRLRTYGTGILKVGRAQVGLSNCAMRSSDVQVKAAAGAVYWITVSDTAALAIELNDSIGDGGTDRWGIDLPVGGYIHCVFDPPLEFTTGIWLDVSTATCKVSIGYL